LRESLCYPILKYCPCALDHKVNNTYVSWSRTISKYLDQPVVREKLGVDSVLTSNFSACDNGVGERFDQTLDMTHRTVDHIGALLDRGVGVLIYVGTYDWICNWVGNERWTLAVEWSGHEEFVKEELREWVVDGKKAGLVRSKGGLTFVTVDAAGHMVCLFLFVG
jgi:carboxypeptidase C (cathepsin A)